MGIHFSLYHIERGCGYGGHESCQPGAEEVFEGCLLVLSNDRSFQLLVKSDNQGTKRYVGKVVDSKSPIERFDPFILVHVFYNLERAYLTVLSPEQLKPLLDGFCRRHDEVMEGRGDRPHSPVQVRMVLPRLVVGQPEHLHGVFVDGEEEPVCGNAAHHQNGTAREVVSRPSALVDPLGYVHDSRVVAGLAVSLNGQGCTLMLSRGSIDRCYDRPAIDPAE